MEGKLDFRDILTILKRYRGLIISFGIVTAILAWGISYFLLDPLYESTSQILVIEETGETPGFDERNIQAELLLVNTYSEILESPAILERVIEQLQLTSSVDELKNQVSIISNPGSQLIGIAVAAESQAEAVDIANMIAVVFQEEIRDIMNLDNVQILSAAEAEENPASIVSNPLFNTVVGAAVGLMIGIGLAFLLAYLDTSIKDERDIEELLGLPVLATISPAQGSRYNRNTENAPAEEDEV